MNFQFIIHVLQTLISSKRFLERNSGKELDFTRLNWILPTYYWILPRDESDKKYTRRIIHVAKRNKPECHWPQINLKLIIHFDDFVYVFK
jgi:hypothetical protein